MCRADQRKLSSCAHHSPQTESSKPQARFYLPKNRFNNGLSFLVYLPWFILLHLIKHRLPEWFFIIRRNHSGLAFFWCAALAPVRTAIAIIALRLIYFLAVTGAVSQFQGATKQDTQNSPSQHRRQTTISLFHDYSHRETPLLWSLLCPLQYRHRYPFDLIPQGYRLTYNRYHNS